MRRTLTIQQWLDRPTLIRVVKAAASNVLRIAAMIEHRIGGLLDKPVIIETDKQRRERLGWEIVSMQINRTTDC